MDPIGGSIGFGLMNSLRRVSLTTVSFKTVNDQPNELTINKSNEIGEG